MRNFGLSFALAIARTSARVVFTRLNRILSFCSEDQRLLAIGSPARLMIPICALNAPFPFPRRARLP